MKATRNDIIFDSIKVILLLGICVITLYPFLNTLAVSLNDPLDTIRGERVKYNQTTSVYQAFGGPQSSAQGGRVRSLATPSAKTDAAIEACKRKSTNG